MKGSISESVLQLEPIIGEAGKGSARRQSPLLPFLRGQGGQNCPSLAVLLLYLLLYFSMKIQLKAIYVQILTDIHLIALYSLIERFIALSFLLAPLPCFCSGTPTNHIPFETWQGGFPGAWQPSRLRRLELSLHRRPSMLISFFFHVYF